METKETRIPKVIHYCWFGGNPMPELAQKCIASWKKYCPDYEIKEWNETNIDINSIDYMREAYEEKAWPFVSDVARLQIIYEYGGIYLDTDVEILRSFDPLLDDGAFMGLEDGKHVASGLGFGAEKNHKLIKSLLDDYRGRHFCNADGTLDRTACPAAQSVFFRKAGLVEKDMRQELCGAVIYPSEFFCPRSFHTGLLTLTDHTYSIHHYDGSWCTDEQKARVSERYRIFQKWGHLAEPVWLLTRVKIKIQRDGLWGTFLVAQEKIKNGLIYKSKGET